jgi:hypothetical protein
MPASDKRNYFLNRGLEILPYFLFSLPVLLTAGLPFFWDTIQLASRHAHFFYESNFSSVFLPNDMDSGHIPAFGMYLAFIWKIFGKTLIASHISMLPFVMGAVYFTRKLTDMLFQTRWNWLITCFLLTDATILTQFTLVSPDIWILFFLSMALFSSFREKRVLLALAMIGLTLTSMRGMMIVAAMFGAGWIVFLMEQTGTSKSLVNTSWRYILKSLPVFLPALLTASVYLVFHYIRTGWIGYHTGMPWAEHFQRVNTAGVFRNLLIMGWRLADNGRILIWLTGFMLAGLMISRKIKIDLLGKRLLVFTLVLLVPLSYSALMYKNLSGHRYLIPVFFMGTLTVLYHLFNRCGTKWKPLIAGILALGMVSGNFWVYPDRISKGWDAMLAYLPYQHLRKEMIQFIELQHINYSEVGTDFPNNIPLKFIELNDETRSFGSKEDKMNNFRYIFYSNVFNGFSDAELNALKSEWKVIKTLHRGQVKVIMYENPKKISYTEFHRGHTEFHRGN